MVEINALGILYQAFLWIGLALLASVIAFALGALGMIMYRLLKYRIKVTIMDHVGQSHIVINDIAREVIEKKGGKTFLQLLKSKTKIALPNPEKYIASGSKKVLMLHRHNDMITPMGVTHNSPASFNFNMDDLVSVLFWREQDHQEALESYRGKLGIWDRYQVPIIFGTFMIIQFVLFFILFQKLGTLSIHVDTSQVIS